MSSIDTIFMVIRWMCPRDIVALSHTCRQWWSRAYQCLPDYQKMLQTREVCKQVVRLVEPQDLESKADFVYHPFGLVSLATRVTTSNVLYESNVPISEWCLRGNGLSKLVRIPPVLQSVCIDSFELRDHLIFDQMPMAVILMDCRLCHIAPEFWLRTSHPGWHSICLIECAMQDWGEGPNVNCHMIYHNHTLVAANCVADRQFTLVPLVLRLSPLIVICNYQQESLITWENKIMYLYHATTELSAPMVTDLHLFGCSISLTSDHFPMLKRLWIHKHSHDLQITGFQHLEHVYVYPDTSSPSIRDCSRLKSITPIATPAVGFEYHNYFEEFESQIEQGYITPELSMFFFFPKTSVNKFTSPTHLF
jgi:hypothetical protein